MEALTKEQHEILIGGLLGDFCLFQQKSAINPLLVVGRSSKDLDYLKYEFEIFKEYCKQGITHHTKTIKGYDKIYQIARFRTRSLPIFLPYKEKWYPNGKKIIPRDIELTPLTLAIWFCDDGCLTFKTNRSGGKDEAMILKFASHGFSEDDNIFLVSLLEKETNEKFYTYKYKNGTYIKGYTAAAKAFIKLTEAVLPNSMSRKYIWRRSDE